MYNVGNRMFINYIVDGAKEVLFKTADTAGPCFISNGKWGCVLGSFNSWPRPKRKLSSDTLPMNLNLHRSTSIPVVSPKAYLLIPLRLALGEECVQMLLTNR